MVVTMVNSKVKNITLTRLIDPSNVGSSMAIIRISTKLTASNTMNSLKVAVHPDPCRASHWLNEVLIKMRMIPATIISMLLALISGRTWAKMMPTSDTITIFSTNAMFKNFWVRIPVLASAAGPPLDSRWVSARKVRLQSVAGNRRMSHHVAMRTSATSNTRTATPNGFESRPPGVDPTSDVPRIRALNQSVVSTCAIWMMNS